MSLLSHGCRLVPQLKTIRVFKNNRKFCSTNNSNKASTPIIFKGPPMKFKEREISFGEFVYQQLKQLPPDVIGHVHAETGDEASNRHFLQMSKRVACGLEALNISKGDVVAIFDVNTMNMSYAATASILINSVCAPLDPSLMPYDLFNMLKQYQPNCVFCNERDASKILDSLNSLQIKAPLILLDKEGSSDSRFLGFGEVLKHGPKPTKLCKVKELDKEMALIVHSSGSTGPPKGVVYSHKASVRLMETIGAQPYPFSHGIQTSHLFWITGMYSILRTFMGMNRIFLSDPNLKNIIDVQNKYKAEIIYLSPYILANLLKRPCLKPTILEPIKFVLTGGGPLPPWILEEFNKIFQGIPQIAQCYAMTENCLNVTSPLPGGDPKSAGVLADGIELKVIDVETGKMLGEEEIGEIRIKHDYQMLGYIGNPEASKEAFDEDGWLKTGDLGHMKNGFLYITGRIKTLIKFRNLQISAQEIEILLSSLKGVQDVGVHGIPNEEDQHHVMALIVRYPHSNITAEEIHKHVADNLSPHKKLLGGVAFVDSLPRNPHTKIQRKELSELALQHYPTSIKPK